MKIFKLGIIVKDNNVFSWQQKIIEKLINSLNIEILILKTQMVWPIQNNLKVPSLYHFYDRLDRTLFKQKINYLNIVDSISFLNGIPNITFNSIEIYYADDGTKSVYRQIAHYNLDLILNFSTLSCEKYFVNVSKYGILSYRLDGENKENEYPACYWEIVKETTEIGASAILTDNFGKESAVSRVSLSTYPNSVHINRDQISKLGPLIISRIIFGLKGSGQSFLQKSIETTNREKQLKKKTLERYPNSIEVMYNSVVLLKRFLIKNMLYKELGRWSVQYKFNCSTNYNTEFSSFTRLKCRNGAFLADPFVISKDDKSFIFLEEYDYKKDKGRISVISVDDAGNQSSIHSIIDNSYHMSYPFIFELDKTYYLMPETSSTKSIELYKCLEFPNKWEFCLNIMENVNAKDSTLFYYDQKWWLFTSMNETGFNELNFNELFLFYTDDIFSSKWQSHPKNPIVNDPKLSRPAGKVFINEGKIYRPSQDCSGTYGNAININQITKLNEKEYMENLVSKIRPDWDHNLAGLHTLNFDKNITLIDVLQPRRKF